MSDQGRQGCWLIDYLLETCLSAGKNTFSFKRLGSWSGSICHDSLRNRSRNDLSQRTFIHFSTLLHLWRYIRYKGNFTSKMTINWTKINDQISDNIYFKLPSLRDWFILLFTKLSFLYKWKWTIFAWKYKDRKLKLEM